MIAFSLQTALLMVAAYLLGAALACMIRRSFASGVQQPATAERRVDPLPEVMQRNAAGSARLKEEPPSAPPAAAPAPPPPAAKPAPAAVDRTPQDLKRIALIDGPTEAALNKLGINRYDQIAAWMVAHVQRVDQALGQKGRANRENWIEQAQILAKGGETHYSARRARGEEPSAAPTSGEGEPGPPPPAGPLPRPMSRAGVAAVVVAPPPAAEIKAPPAAPAPAPAAPLPPAAPPLVSERAAFATRPARADAPAVPVRPVPSPAHDNLLRIGGVAPEIQEALNQQGVSRYSQIAQWSPADVQRFEQLLQIKGRIARENWVEQAQILSRGGDTRFSREFDAPAPGDAQPPRPIKLPEAIQQQSVKATEAVKSDLGALRSVRSQAYQSAPQPGPEAVERAAALKVGRGAGQDDLKRIRGIGVLIEKRLGSLGVSTYEQIANWTAADIERISNSLDFKGRIERENWVEQARILSAGGSTEFARRVDRGEVETSRAKT